MKKPILFVVIALVVFGLVGTGFYLYGNYTPKEETGVATDTVTNDQLLTAIQDATRAATAATKADGTATAAATAATTAATKAEPTGSDLIEAADADKDLLDAARATFSTKFAALEEAKGTQAETTAQEEYDAALAELGSALASYEKAEALAKPYRVAGVREADRLQQEALAQEIKAAEQALAATRNRAGELKGETKAALAALGVKTPATATAARRQPNGKVYVEKAADGTPHPYAEGLGLDRVEGLAVQLTGYTVSEDGTVNNATVTVSAGEKVLQSRKGLQFKLGDEPVLVATFAFNPPPEEEAKGE